MGSAARRRALSPHHPVLPGTDKQILGLWSKKYVRLDNNRPVMVGRRWCDVVIILVYGIQKRSAEHHSPLFGICHCITMYVVHGSSLLSSIQYPPHTNANMNDKHT
jgi:hypothetical protein